MSQPVEAVTTSKVFAKYPNAYFIETGSLLGDGIQMALDAGFQKVYSIELAPHYYEKCRERFAGNSNVLVFLGDSTYVLPELMKHIHAPATFWLDGHYSWGISSGKGELNSPILAELESIRQSAIKTHTILIDDIRLLGTEHFDYVTLDQLIIKLLEINPNYTITFENGYIENDVLVAYIP